LTDVFTIKIIQILNHSPPSSSYFYDVLFNDWHARVGQRLFNAQKDLDVECWIPSFQIRKKMVIHNGGLTYKAFPSVNFRAGCEFSPSLINELKKLVNKEDVIIHIHGDRDVLTYTISSVFKKAPIILQHHGSSDRSEFKYLDLSSIERRAFRNVDYFLVLTNAKKRYLETDVGIASKKILVQTMGVDFNVFRPLSKEKCRRELGLPMNDIIMLFVGKFEKFPRGADVILNTFKSLRKKLDFSLIMIGGNSTDSLFSLVKKEATCALERVPHDVLPLYYNSSDVFTWFCSEKANYYGGIGISPVESLACNVPVVSTTLGMVSDVYRPKLGEIPTNPKDVEACVLRAVESNATYDCRNVARKHYDWKQIIQKTLSLYERLSDVYF
jgi:glycosyltransferase involved in cell wall biosynthesis